ncbi:MAG: hypothetical protein R6U98_21750 [Pirellulaceae bacterium]
MKAWIAYWSILRKDMRTYYLKPPNLSWGIIFPLAWTLMFFIKSGSAVDVRSLLLGRKEYRISSKESRMMKLRGILVNSGSRRNEDRPTPCRPAERQGVR